MISMVDHAILLGNGGFPVFAVREPCGDGMCRQWPELGYSSQCDCGKAPATRHGKDDATIVEAEIRSMWRNRNYNIGIRLPENVIGIDGDPRNGATLDHLGVLPRTLTVASGGGGWHFYFLVKGKVAGKLAGAPGFDIKSSSGYLVAPPSRHPSGNPYRWAMKAPVAPLPRHLIDRVRPAHRKQYIPKPGDVGNYSGLIEHLQHAPLGERNARLNKCAWIAARQGAPEEVFTALEAVANSIGDNPGKIASTIDRARRAIQ